MASVEPPGLAQLKLAGEIVNRTLKSLVELARVGGKVTEICYEGDNKMLTEFEKIRSKEHIRRDMGIAFPTCVSVNHVINHFSPTNNDPDYVIKENDVVKIDLGVHVEGFIAVSAHTVIASTSEKILAGRNADTVLAAYWAAKKSIELLKPGRKMSEISAKIQEVAEEFRCQPIKGMVSHRLERYKIDGKTIVVQGREFTNDEKNQYEIQVNDVIALDVIVSSGKGTFCSENEKNYVYKMEETKKSIGKLSKPGKDTMREITKKHKTMPFSLRNIKSQSGLQDCVSLSIIDTFHVLFEEESEVVAQFKFTLVVLPSEVQIVAGLDLEVDQFLSNEIDIYVGTSAIMPSDISLKVKASQNVLSVKTEVENIFKVNSNYQQLSFGNQKLQDTALLSAYGIADGDKLGFRILTPKFHAVKEAIEILLTQGSDDDVKKTALDILRCHGFCSKIIDDLEDRNLTLSQELKEECRKSEDNSEFTGVLTLQMHKLSAVVEELQIKVNQLDTTIIEQTAEIEQLKVKVNQQDIIEQATLIKTLQQGGLEEIIKKLVVAEVTEELKKRDNHPK